MKVVLPITMDQIYKLAIERLQTQRSHGAGNPEIWEKYTEAIRQTENLLAQSSRKDI